MKIVVLDGYTENPGDLSWDSLGELGELTVYDRTLGGEEETIRRNWRRADRADEQDGDHGKRACRLPVGALHRRARHGLQYRGRGSGKATRHPVCNIPSYCAESVAQLTFALLLEICHHAGDHSRAGP